MTSLNKDTFRLCHENVSIAGITGTKAPDIKNLQNIINKIKTYTDIPIGVGFGIKDSGQVKNISQFSDAVVVGSAIVNKINDLKKKNLTDDDLVDYIKFFLLDLSDGLNI